MSFDFVESVFSGIQFSPVKINGKSREHEKVSLQQKKKDNGSSEIIIRISKALMVDCQFEYGTQLYLSYGEDFKQESFMCISKNEEDATPFGSKLSKQNNKRDNSAGVIRITYKTATGLPDFLCKESDSDGALKRVKYVHDEMYFSAQAGILKFKLKLSIKE